MRKSTKSAPEIVEPRTGHGFKPGPTIESPVLKSMTASDPIQIHMQWFVSVCLRSSTIALDVAWSSVFLSPKGYTKESVGEHGIFPPTRSSFEFTNNG